LQGISKGAPRYVPGTDTGLPLYIPETYASGLEHAETAFHGSPYPEMPAETAIYIADSRAETISEAPAVEMPTVLWQTPAPVLYGTPLGVEQFNATSSVPGSFAYIPANGYVLPAGTHILWATFHPEEGGIDDAIQASVSLEVKRATPHIQWPIPADLAGGMVLTAAQLNAESNVPGVFLYTPAEGEMPGPGKNMLSVTFTPTDFLNYTNETAEAPLYVHSTASTILWPNPATISYGTALSAAQLNATASCPGTFRYAPDMGSVLPVGRHSLHVQFIPAEGVGSPPLQAEVTLTVVKERPTIHWPAPTSIVYGTALSRNELNATASISGAFVYIPGEGVVLAAGKHTSTAIFTPTDGTNYATTQTAVTMMVLKATPILDWPMPRAIAHGTALSARELNASASVPGRLIYAPAADTVLAGGTHTLSVSLTPTDHANYAMAQATVQLEVNESENRESLTYRDTAESEKALDKDGAYESRTYNGVTYLKDAEGQWHPLQ